MAAKRSQFAIVNGALLASMASIGTTATTVFLALAYHANEDRSCYPKEDRLADLTGLSKRTIQRALADLSAAGLLEIDKTTGNRNIYRLLDSSDTSDATPSEVATPVTPRSDTSDATVATPVTPLVATPVTPQEQDHINRTNKQDHGTSGGTAADVPVPAELDTPAFLAKWQEWQATRRKNKKPVTARAAKLQLDELAEIGPGAAIRCINQSIKNDYQGLFPDKFRSSPSRDTFARQRERNTVEAVANWQPPTKDSP